MNQCCVNDADTKVKIENYLPEEFDEYNYIHDANDIKQELEFEDEEYIDVTQEFNTEIKQEIDIEYMKYECHNCVFITQDFSKFQTHVNECVNITVQLNKNDNETNTDEKSLPIKKPAKTTCTVCGIPIQTRQYARHLRTHNDGKPFQCDICSKTFLTPIRFKYHKKSHTRPYKCEVCGKGFAYSSGLTNHKRTHTGEKPFGCKFCSKSFAEPSTLRSHVTTHTGEKSYKCKVCGRPFSDSSGLSKHMRTHSREKPFVCKVCGKAFTLSYTLKCHLAAHLGDKPFECNICGKEFNSVKSLRSHTKIWHESLG